MKKIFSILIITPLLLTSCAGTGNFKAVNEPGLSQFGQNTNLINANNKPDKDTLIALAFSGGGMRSSAFSYGVLKSLSEIPLNESRDKNLTDAVDFVSGVSGGSVTAAYFALKGPNGFYDFRQRFLDKNAESGLRTDISVNNILRMVTLGGVNDQDNLPTWLNNNLFDGATYAQILKQQRPILWIGASDIFNRTPFVFSNTTFNPLCSDLSKVRLADAVSASAAVPGAFSPVNIESFASRCDWKEPAWVNNNDLYYSQQSTLEAFRRYRDPVSLKYIKLLDGGLTDNFGIQGITLARISEGTPYAPLTKERAVRLKRALFMIVNSGRGPVHGEWNKREDNPSFAELASAVSDTAIDASVHVTFDFFKVVMTKWNDDLVKWRCSLSKAEIESLLGAESKGWKCNDVHFYITQTSFSDTGPQNKARLDRIPTRFVLPPEDINFLIDSADIAVKNNVVFNKFLQSMK